MVRDRTSKSKKKSLSRQQLDEIKKEAARRYTDTSWRIFNQSRQKSAPKESDDKDGELSHPPNESTNNNVDDVDSSGSSIVYEKIRRPESRQVVEVETVESHVEVFVHAQDESMKNGHDMSKMLRSTSHNGFGVETTQPRSERCAAAAAAPPSAASAGMDLCYVTERIISLWFPGEADARARRRGQQQAAHMLRNKHGDNYMVFNLSEPKRSLRSEHKHVKEVGWPPFLAPPLERLCSVCKEIDSWLAGDQHRIAVLHARENKDKLGVIVAAYMHYSSICGNAEQALDRFSMRRFLDDNVGPLAIPSNKRYVDYFAGLLSHNIKINASPMYLTHVTVVGAPNFQAGGGCKAFLKVYEGHTPVYTSGVYSVSSGTSHFTVNVWGTGEGGRKGAGLRLRGDVLVKCYHRASDRARDAVFACQFHTCAVADHTLSFTRQQLDVACNDIRFPVDGAVELHFSPGPEGRHPVPAPTPAVPFTVAADDDHVTRADSPLFVEEYDNDEDDFNDEDVNHTFGPLDGSIYATIAKKPELSPGAVSSPLTVSMDSGISSAGHQQHANTTASSASPPPPSSSPLSPEDHHRQLDELLSDMMLTVQSIPDLQPQTTTRHQRRERDVNNVRYIDDDSVDDLEDSDDLRKERDEETSASGIPYHARQASQPFSYGVSADMVAAATATTTNAAPGGKHPGLSSPGLVRKTTGTRMNRVGEGGGDTLQRVQTHVYPGDFPYGKRDPIDDVFTQSALNAQPLRREFREEFYKEEVKRFDPLKRSLTEGSIRRSPEKNYVASPTSPPSESAGLSPPGAFRNATRSPEFHEGYAAAVAASSAGGGASASASGNLTWLQRQQQKLKERRELVLREERRPHESRLLTELRASVQSRRWRPTASHRLDGYTSDTTAFADDDDDDDFTVPLHINTKNGGDGAKASERPFVGVKRAHERYTQNGTLSSTSSARILAAHPLGHVVQPPSRPSPRPGTDQPDSGGLLSLAEGQKQQPYPTDGRRTTVRIEGAPAESVRLDDLIANLADGSTNPTPSAWQLRREESVQSWRSAGSSASTTEPDSSPSHAAASSSSPRPQTPAFPVHARTPYYNAAAAAPAAHVVQFDLSATAERLPPKSPTTQRKDRPASPTELIGTEYSHTLSQHRGASRDNVDSPKSPAYNGSYSPTVYYGTSRRSSINSNESPHEVSAANVKFVRDSSKYWYKSTISREQAIGMLRDQPPGTFLVRDSNSFPGAFGLALRVATVPFNVKQHENGADELIRHFLIEPTTRGVRLKGCQNEPVFGSLSALIYQHSITQMALPCKLVLPDDDSRYGERSADNFQQHSLFTQGAACNVLYLATFDMESLTGPQAVKKASTQLFADATASRRTATVHFKVSDQGVTLTDNKRQLFFRRHYPLASVSHCGVDPDDRRWLVDVVENGAAAAGAATAKSTNRIFGFVARKPNVSNPDNQCHLFAELEPEQPATAIVNFLNKVLASSGLKPNIV